MIWSLAVVNPSRQDVLYDGSIVHRLGWGSLPALFYTNSQIRAEAAEMFFSQHTFVLQAGMLQHRSGLGDVASDARLRDLLAVSGNVWNEFVRCVVVLPQDISRLIDYATKEWRLECYDPSYATLSSRKIRKEAKLRQGVVWTAFDKIKGLHFAPELKFGPEMRYEVVGESLDHISEKAIGWHRRQTERLRVHFWSELGLTDDWFPEDSCGEAIFKEGAHPRIWYYAENASAGYRGQTTRPRQRYSRPFYSKYLFE